MNQLKTLPLRSIRPHPRNPRFDLGDLTELTQDIRDSGLIEPLVVIPGSWGKDTGECRDCGKRIARTTSGVLVEHLDGSATCPGGSEPAADDWYVVAGHRRREACIAAGMWDAPCIARFDLKSDADVLVVMMRENSHRRDLTPLEEASGYEQLTLEGLTATRIAQQTHRSKKTVDRRLALNRLDPAVKTRLRQGVMTLQDAEALLALTPEKAARALRSVGTKEFRQDVAREVAGDDNEAIAAHLRAEFIGPFLSGAQRLPKGSQDRVLREVVATIAACWPHRPTVRAWCAAVGVGESIELSAVPPLRALMALAVTVEKEPAGQYDLLGALGYEASPVELDIIEQGA